MSEVINGAALEVVSDYDALSKAAANHVFKLLAESPTSSLLVPTGTTPEGLYALLAKQSPATFDGVTFYNLDEYCEPADLGEYRLLLPSDERSYQSYMARHILQAMPGIRSFFPGIENIRKPGSYDKQIAENGGIDLAINAIGEDGHTFGFNLPGSEFDSVTRLITVNEGTRTVNERLTQSEVPEHAVSAGLATGLESREIVTLVSGERKAEILRRAIWDDVSPEIPATVLRQHPNHLFIVDQAAASKLQ